MGTAAAANLPALFLVLYWRGLTPRGAVGGIVTGLALSFVLISIGPIVMVDTLKFDHALIRMANPTLVAMVGSVLVSWLLSVTDSSTAALASRAKFAEQEITSERS